MRTDHKSVEIPQIIQLVAGEPVFRSVDVRQRIWDERPTDRSVARIVKSRVETLLKQRGRSNKEAEELVELISGHSLRAYATSAAAGNMPAHRIQSHTRHKSAQMVTGYLREADKWTKSGLDGIGF